MPPPSSIDLNAEWDDVVDDDFDDVTDDLISEWWTQAASLPGASPETARYAALAQKVVAGGNPVRA